MARSIKKFASDLKRNIQKVKKTALSEIAEDVLKNAQSLAPRDSGRLAASGRAYVGTEQVACGSDIFHEGAQKYELGMFKFLEDNITIVFSTPKKVGQGASVYYGSGWFDYALYWSGKVSISRPQHLKAFWLEKAYKSYP